MLIQRKIFVWGICFLVQGISAQQGQLVPVPVIAQAPRNDRASLLREVPSQQLIRNVEIQAKMIELLSPDSWYADPVEALNRVNNLLDDHPWLLTARFGGYPLIYKVAQSYKQTLPTETAAYDLVNRYHYRTWSSGSPERRQQLKMVFREILNRGHNNPAFLCGVQELSVLLRSDREKYRVLIDEYFQVYGRNIDDPIVIPAAAAAPQNPPAVNNEAEEPEEDIEQEELQFRLPRNAQLMIDASLRINAYYMNDHCFTSLMEMLRENPWMALGTDGSGKTLLYKSTEAYKGCPREENRDLLIKICAYLRINGADPHSIAGGNGRESAMHLLNNELRVLDDRITRYRRYGIDAEDDVSRSTILHRLQRVFNASREELLRDYPPLEEPAESEDEPEEQDQNVQQGHHQNIMQNSRTPAFSLHELFMNTWKGRSVLGLMVGALFYGAYKYFTGKNSAEEGEMSDAEMAALEAQN